MKRSARAGPLVLVAQLLFAGVAMGATDEWTLTASRTTFPLGVATNVDIRATDTDGSGDIACVWVTIPKEFDVHSATVRQTTGETPWSASISNSGSGRTVRVRNPDGGGKLKEGDWVEFRVQVTAQKSDKRNWIGKVSQGEDCKDPFLPDIELAMTVGPGATPAPTPTPTPTPSPQPTPTPAPTRSPAPTSTPKPPASPDPTQTATPSPSPATPRPTSTHGPSPSPTATDSPQGTALPKPTPTQVAEPSALGGEPSPSPAPSAGSGSNQVPGPPSTGPAVSPPAVGSAIGDDVGVGDRSHLDVPNAGGWDSDVDLAGFDSSLSFGSIAWMIPGFFLGLPGLLLLIVIGGQILGAAIFVPVTRRLLGKESERTRRSSVTSADGSTTGDRGQASG